MDELFPKIFFNRYLIRYISIFIRERNEGLFRSGVLKRRARSYECICDVEWMLKNKLNALLKDKLVRVRANGLSIFDELHWTELSVKMAFAVLNDDVSLFRFFYDQVHPYYLHSGKMLKKILISIPQNRQFRSLNLYEEPNSTCFSKSLQGGNLEIIGWLYQQIRDDPKSVSLDHETNIISAMASGRKEVVDWYLETLTDEKLSFPSRLALSMILKNDWRDLLERYCNDVPINSKVKAAIQLERLDLVQEFLPQFSNHRSIDHLAQTREIINESLKLEPSSLVNSKIILYIFEKFQVEKWQYSSVEVKSYMKAMIHQNLYDEFIILNRKLSCCLTNTEMEEQLDYALKKGHKQFIEYFLVKTIWKPKVQPADLPIESLKRVYEYYTEQKMEINFSSLFCSQKLAKAPENLEFLAEIGVFMKLSGKAEVPYSGAMMRYIDKCVKSTPGATYPNISINANSYFTVSDFVWMIEIPIYKEYFSTDGFIKKMIFNGRADIVQYLHSIFKFSVTGDHLTEAIHSGTLSMVKMILKLDPTLITQKFVYIHPLLDHVIPVDILRYLNEKLEKFEFKLKIPVLKKIFDENNLPLIKLLHRMNPVGVFSSDIMKLSTHSFSIFKFLFENRTEGGNAHQILRSLPPSPNSIISKYLLDNQKYIRQYKSINTPMNR